MLTRSLTDVLSHVAIRARSQGTLLASCFDQAEWAALQPLAGKHMELAVAADGRVTATEAVKSTSGATRLRAASPKSLILFSLFGQQPAIIAHAKNGQPILQTIVEIGRVQPSLL